MFNKLRNLLSFEGVGNINIQSGNSTSIVKGKSVSINSNNGKRQVIVDGVDVSDVINGFEIKIVGDIKKLDSLASTVTIEGNVGAVDTTSGAVTIKGNVDGDIDSTSGAVKIEGSMTGNIETVSGSVRANTIKANFIETISGSVQV